MTATVRLVVNVDHRLADDLVNATGGFIRWREANGESYSPLIVDIGRRAIEARRRLSESQSAPPGGPGSHTGRCVVVSAGRGTLTVAEVVKFTGISRSTLYRLWREGEGPRSVLIRQRRLVRIEDIEEWLAAA